MLALANAELAGDTCAAADAHCDARYAPPEADASAFTVPLDGELFLPVPNSRATRISCATYKANFPIEVRVPLGPTALGVVVLTPCWYANTHAGQVRRADLGERRRVRRGSRRPWYVPSWLRSHQTMTKVACERED